MTEATKSNDGIKNDDYSRPKDNSTSLSTIQMPAISLRGPGTQYGASIGVQPDFCRERLLWANEKTNEIVAPGRYVSYDQISQKYEIKWDRPLGRGSYGEVFGIFLLMVLSIKV